MVIDPAVLSDRRSSDDPALYRDAPRDRARKCPRRRLWLRRAGDRGPEARLRASRTFDVDEAAVEAAACNVQANGVEVDVRLLAAASDKLPAGGDRRCEHRSADLGRLAVPSKPTALVTSGYYETDHLTFPGLAHLARKTDAGWAADLFGRQ